MQQDPCNQMSTRSGILASRAFRRATNDRTAYEGSASRPAREANGDAAGATARLTQGRSMTAKKPSM